MNEWMDEGMTERTSCDLSSCMWRHEASCDVPPAYINAQQSWLDYWSFMIVTQTVRSSEAEPFICWTVRSEYNNIYSRFIRSAENTLLDNSSSKERTNVLDTSRLIYGICGFYFRRRRKEKSTSQISHKAKLIGTSRFLTKKHFFQ